MYKASDGVPRLVNFLANKAMPAAFGEGAHGIDTQHVRLAMQDTESTFNPFTRLKIRLLRYVTALLGVFRHIVGPVQPDKVVVSLKKAGKRREIRLNSHNECKNQSSRASRFMRGLSRLLLASSTHLRNIQAFVNHLHPCMLTGVL